MRQRLHGMPDMTYQVDARRITRLLASGDAAGALAAANRLVQHAPGPDSLRLLASVSGQAGDQRSRFDALYGAACDLGDLRAGAELAQMLVQMRPSASHPDVDRAWTLAFLAPWGRPDHLLPGALAYLEMDDRVSAALDRPHDNAALDQAALHLVDHPLFQAMASVAVISDPRWESLLLRWRDLTRHRWLDTHVADLNACSWLALQANLMGYLWPLDGIAEEVAQLRAQLAAAGTARSAAVLLACHEHPGPEASSLFASPGPITLLAQRLYSEPELESHLGASIVAATARQHLPHNAVRTQYERYPYPRWVAEPSLANALPETVRVRMKTRRFDRPRVLLAGCGTGQQCIAARATYPSARITALDFSVASLAYALRKCQEAGHSGITFEAGELEAFAQRGFKFDLIECTGVLHHLPDLDAGAAALRQLAMPGSLLRLSVYSAAARAPVQALRSKLAAAGADNSPASLRRLHQHVLSGQFGLLPHALLHSPDLYSASGLHDLLFNACEHALGACAWVELLDRHDFNWICMDPPGAALQAAMATAGQAAATWTPAQWESFEERHPFAFAGMYEFWFSAR